MFASKTNDEKKASRYFIRMVAKGKILTVDEIKSYVRRNNLKIGQIDMQQLRTKWISTAVRRTYKAPQIHQTVSIPKLGEWWQDWF